MSAAAVQYKYDSRNKRIWRSILSNGNLAQEVYFCGVDGQKIGTYTIQLVLLNGNIPQMSDNTGIKLSTFFGSKRIGTYDRLGSAKFNANGQQQSFYPYGEDRGTVQPNDSLKFATYTRDTATGLDYADQRYYANNFGRFMSPDPYVNNAGPDDPRSWNRYAYVRGDPANLFDPRGLEGEDPSYCDTHPSDPNCSGIFICPDGTQILIGGVCPTPTGQPSGRRKPGQSAGFQNCHNPKGPYQTTDVEFVKDWRDAVEIGQLTGLPAGFILAWASLESYNAAADGLGPAATQNNNFFGLTYRKDTVAAETAWNNSIVCPPGSYDGVSGPGGHSRFDPNDAFVVSGLSALLSFGDKYLNAADVYLQLSGNPTDAGLGQATAAAGFNPGNAAAYGAAIASRYKRLSQYLNCADQ